ncbi:hypothetical protein [Stenotrophomonas sp. Ps181]|uniref:hypothetical protein n=1 Tax=Stenotrophomonas sp. Ps181 TaxID=2859892 RepID=UPI0021E1462D|nr:hypothetical protein [Stenotrophomonas sp. Ps181]MCV0218795.1 hypothetical protein [Stenotrophomonas sp. Ps181]
MDLAFNTITGQKHIALEFSLLPPEQIQALRRNFICDECKEPGYFRKASVSGRGPCFGARHLDNCQLAVRSEDPWGEAGDDLVQRLEADNTKIILGMSVEDGAEGRAGGVRGHQERGGGGRRFAGGGEPAKTKIQRNADKLLEWLYAAPTFKTSNLVIATPGGDIPVNEFFVEIPKADRKKHVGELRGYWGELTRTNQYYNTQVFNGAPKPALGFEILPALAKKLEARYQLEAITGLVGRKVLFIGRARETQNGSFMMEVSGMSYVGLLPEGYQIG